MRKGTLHKFGILAKGCKRTTRKNPEEYGKLKQFVSNRTGNIKALKGAGEMYKYDGVPPCDNHYKQMDDEARGIVPTYTGTQVWLWDDGSIGHFPPKDKKEKQDVLELMADLILLGVDKPE